MIACYAKTVCYDYLDTHTYTHVGLLADFIFYFAGVGRYNVLRHADFTCDRQPLSPDRIRYRRHAYDSGLATMSPLPSPTTLCISLQG